MDYMTLKEDGKHHGESEEARELGLEIISRMRARMDEETKRTGLNLSLIHISY